MIRFFKGQYEYLSNYYDPCLVEYDGLTYRNSEAAYQAQKCKNPDDRKMFRNLSPDDAKKLGKKVELTDDWNSKKAKVMRIIVHEKFRQHEDLATQLLETGEEFLVEGNYWHDNFFGECYCPLCRIKKMVPQNWLGKCLMSERDILKAFSREVRE